jgi:hypothetical protein
MYMRIEGSSNIVQRQTLLLLLLLKRDTSCEQRSSLKMLRVPYGRSETCCYNCAFRQKRFTAAALKYDARFH